MSGEKQTKFDRALSFQKDGQLEAAKAILEEVLQENPAHVEVLHLLGLIAYQTGNAAQAASFISKAVTLNPNNAVFHYDHGLALQRLREHEAAIISFDKAVTLAPQASHIYYSLGLTLLELEEFKAAAGSFSKAADLDPNNADAHNSLGVVLQKLKLFADAEASYRRAIEVHPDYAEPHHNLGNILSIQGRRFESLDCFRRAISLKPGMADAHNNLGVALVALGRTAESIFHFRRALAAQADHEKAFDSLIFALDLDPSADIALQQAERKRWCELFTRRPKDTARFSNSPNPNRRLRIGYVSADFKTHGAACAFGAMLLKFNRHEFEIFAYSNSFQADDFTDLLRKSVTFWRDIAGTSDEQVATTIREDMIDILVDLSGHSRGNRLHVFAKKPAPIQITAWGYMTGTGLKEIDFIFGDIVCIPEEEKRFYAENVRYLPSIISGFFPAAFPEINELPALSGSRIVFGSFNRLGKVSDEALNLWARVMAAVPQSVLMIKDVELDDAGHREWVLERLSAAGIDHQRVVLSGSTPWYEHVAAYNRVDICLDSFPHTGAVTTLDALMMGVPVITLKWPTLVGRLSASFLTTLGLNDWIATTKDEYVEIAVRKVQVLPALNELRQNLRQKFTQSIIGDSKTYVATVEREYRMLWGEWCVDQRNTTTPRKWWSW